MTDALADPSRPQMSQTAIWVMLAYLAVLIVLGLMGRFARKETSMGDFFLGGRSLGFVVLLLTLYATQYSGNTMIGFTASAYRSGFKFLVSIIFMMSVIGAYVLFAPQLYRQGRRRGYITLSDYIQDRYRNRTLSILISVSGIVGLGNYLITNLKAMGEMSRVMSGGTIGEATGIVLLAAVILVYETLGGLRSVAWTDVLQGLLLFIGCLVIFATIFNDLGGLEGAAEKLHAARPEFWDPPEISDCLSWSSTTLIVSFGIAMYPHAIQRIYAARSGRTLKRSLQIMVFMPLATTLLMVTFGILGNIPFPSLDRNASESITSLILNHFAASNPSLAWVSALFVGAVFAAIMSTADSALLSISSSVTQDLGRPLTRIEDQRKLTLIGKIVSGLVMAGCAFLAIVLPQNIWQLIQIKTELLAQTAPALIFGIHWKGLRAGPVLGGFLVGTGFTLFFLIGNFVLPSQIPHRLWNVHAGLWGLAFNGITIIVMNGARRIRP